MNFGYDRDETRERDADMCRKLYVTLDSEVIGSDERYEEVGFGPRGLILGIIFCIIARIQKQAKTHELV